MADVEAVTARDRARSGRVAVVGRPNVGKSTLINRMLGVKLSITSRRAQTTRHRILGVLTRPEGQIVMLDTPGIHAGHSTALNRYMNRVAAGALDDVDLVVMVVEALGWTDEDEYVWRRIAASSVPIVLAVNKVDLVSDKSKLLPKLSSLAEKGSFAEIVPICARRARDAARLADVLLSLLPEGEPTFPEDQYTDRSERFLSGEIVREKLTRLLGQEVPHRLTVEIDRFAYDKGRIRIDAVVWVESTGQKAIVIGKGGMVLKRAGTEARRDLERLLGAHVYLQLWVKVRSGWSNDERRLVELGYGE